MSATATKRYAQAIFDLSLEVKKLDAVQSDLKKVHEWLYSSPELHEFLQSPVIPPEKRHEIIDAIFKQHLTALTYQLILFLHKKKRLNYLADICHAFEQMYLEHKGIMALDITSCIALNNHQINEIKRHLKSKFGKEIRPSTAVDPKLIGGITIRQGNTIYDYSFRTQLEQIRKNVITA